MKKTIGCLILMLFLATAGQAQYSQDTIPRQLIRQERQGFPASSYRWNNAAINLHLQQALKYRKGLAAYTPGGAVLLGTGTVMSMAGLLGLMFAPFIQAVSSGLGSDEKVDVTGYAVLLGAGAVVGGGGLSLIIIGQQRRRKAQRQLQLANQLR